MPTYLCHGFRWHREAIRIHIIMHGLQDAAAEWIIAPSTALCLVQSFNKAFNFLPAMPDEFHVQESGIVPPKITDLSLNSASSTSTVNTIRLQQVYMQDDDNDKLPFNEWSPVKLLEEYDSHDLTTCSAPYAYVADQVIPISLSLRITPDLFRGLETLRLEKEKDKDEEGEKIERRQLKEHPNPEAAATESDELKANLAAPDAGLGESANEHMAAEGGTSQTDGSWLEKLRDQLQPTEDIGWYLVVCEDEERDDGLSCDDESSVHEKAQDSELLAQNTLDAETYQPDLQQDDAERSYRAMEAVGQSSQYLLPKILSSQISDHGKVTNGTTEVPTITVPHAIGLVATQPRSAEEVSPQHNGIASVSLNQTSEEAHFSSERCFTSSVPIPTSSSSSTQPKHTTPKSSIAKQTRHSASKLTAVCDSTSPFYKDSDNDPLSPRSPKSGKGESEGGGSLKKMKSFFGRKR